MLYFAQSRGRTFVIGFCSTSCTSTGFVAAKRRCFDSRPSVERRSTWSASSTGSLDSTISFQQPKRSFAATLWYDLMTDAHSCSVVGGVPVLRSPGAPWRCCSVTMQSRRGFHRTCSIATFYATASAPIWRQRASTYQKLVSSWATRISNRPRSTSRSQIGVAGKSIEGCCVRLKSCAREVSHA